MPLNSKTTNVKLKDALSTVGTIMVNTINRVADSLAQALRDLIVFRCATLEYVSMHSILEKISGTNDNTLSENSESESEEDEQLPESEKSEKNEKRSESECEQQSENSELENKEDEQQSLRSKTRSFGFKDVMLVSGIAIAGFVMKAVFEQIFVASGALALPHGSERHDTTDNYSSEYDSGLSDGSGIEYSTESDDGYSRDISDEHSAEHKIGFTDESTSTAVYITGGNRSFVAGTGDYYRGFSEGNASGYKAGRNRGFFAGAEEGEAKGFYRGFSEGNSTGYSAGSDDGYARGMSDCNNHDVYSSYGRGFYAGHKEGLKDYDRKKELDDKTMVIVCAGLLVMVVTLGLYIVCDKIFQCGKNRRQGNRTEITRDANVARDEHLSASMPLLPAVDNSGRAEAESSPNRICSNTAVNELDGGENSLIYEMHKILPYNELEDSCLSTEKRDPSHVCSNASADAGLNRGEDSDLTAEHHSETSL